MRDSDSGFIVGKVHCLACAYDIAVCCNSDFSQEVFLDFPHKDSKKTETGLTVQMVNEHSLQKNDERSGRNDWRWSRSQANRRIGNP